MKKKLLCVFMGLNIVAMLFVGCKKEDNTQKIDNNVDQEEVDIETTSETVDEEITATREWKTEEISVPSLPDVTRRETVFTSKVKTATTFLDLDINEIKVIMDQNEYVAKNFTLAVDKREDMVAQTYENIGDSIAYTITDAVSGKKIEDIDSEYYSNISINLRRNTNSYDNYDEFWFEVSEVPSFEMQEITYGLMKDILPEEIATYLVYAVDEDDVEEEMKLETEVVSPDGNTTYTLRRELYEEEYSAYIRYSISIEDAIAKSNTFAHYDGDYISIHPDLKYNLSNILPTTVGSTDIRNYANLMSNYMKIGGPIDADYRKTILDTANVRCLTGDDGIITTEYSLEMRKASEGTSGIIAPITEMDITIVEKDEEIIRIEFAIDSEAGYADLEEVEAEAIKRKSELVNAATKKLAMIFPDLDVSNIIYSNFEEGLYSGEQIITILGKEINMEYYVGTDTNGLDVYYSRFQVEGEYIK